MSEKDQGYYEPAIADPSNVISLHAEMVRSRDYGDKRYYPDYGELRAIGDTWADELDNPLRSERAKKQIQVLIGRITFELVSRQNDYISEEFAELTVDTAAA
jgi:hypothetical protein